MQLVAFTKEQTKEILDMIGVDTNTYIVGDCFKCGAFLTLKNIGNISQGKVSQVTFNKLYCENPACFAEEVAKKFMNDKENGK